MRLMMVLIVVAAIGSGCGNIGICPGGICELPKARGERIDLVDCVIDEETGRWSCAAANRGSMAWRVGVEFVRWDGARQVADAITIQPGAAARYGGEIGAPFPAEWRCEISTMIEAADGRMIIARR